MTAVRQRPLQQYTIANGRYRVEAILGEGGMGRVVQAWDTHLNASCAIKFLHERTNLRPDLRKRFASEARAMARIRHPNIVTLHRVAEDGDRQVLVMELVDGGTVHQQLETAGPYPPALACSIILQVLSGLRAVHDHGIVHRDIKPHNVLLTSQGAAKLSDFGVAHISDAMTLTQTGAVLGTVAYMAPEQRAGQRKVGVQADIYSVGATLLRMLVPSEPVDLHAPLVQQHFSRHLPGPLWRVIQQATDFRPDARFPDVEAMINAVEGVMPALTMGAATLSGHPLEPVPPYPGAQDTGWTIHLSSEEEDVWAIALDVMHPLKQSETFVPQHDRLARAAQAARAAGDWERAATLAIAAMKTDPKAPPDRSVVDGLLLEPGLSDRARCRLHRAQGATTQDAVAGLRLASRALHFAHQTNDPDEILPCMVNHGLFLEISGELQQAELVLRDAFEFLEQTALASVWESRLSKRLASVLRTRGHLDEAIALCERALYLEQLAGELFPQGETHNILGATYGSRGDFERAIYHARSAISTYEALGAAGASSHAWHDLGVLLMLHGDLDEAIGVLGGANTGYDQERFSWSGTRAGVSQVALAQALVLVGRVEDAHDVVEKGVLLLKGSQSIGLVFGFTVQGLITLAMGDAAAARQQLETGLTHAQQADHAMAIAISHCAFAEYHATLGQVERARYHLDLARPSRTSLGRVWLSAESKLSAAQELAIAG